MLLRIENASVDGLDAECLYAAKANGEVPGEVPVKGLKELAAVVSELQRLASFQDMYSLPVVFELVSRLGARANACLDDLWGRCVGARSDILPDYLSATARRLCFVLLDVFATCIGEMEAVKDASRDAPPGALAANAVRIASWCARWSWLCYEPPPAQLWTSAARFHEFAGQWAAGGGSGTEAAAESWLLTIERDYLAMLILDWLRPNSLSPAALSLLDGALDKCLDGVRLEKEAGGKPAVFLAPASCRLESRGEEGGPPADGQRRFVAVNEVLARLEAYLSRQGGGEAQHEASHVVVMRCVGRRGGCGKRHDPRIGAVRSAYLSCRFGAVSALVRTGGVRALGNGMQGFREGIVLDVSRYGCRISLPAGATVEVAVGCLVAMTCPHKGEITLGIARWIGRDGAESLEIGVEILRGSVSAFPAVGAAAGPSAEFAARPVLVLEQAGEGGRATHLLVLVAKDFLAAAEDIRLLNSPVVLEKSALVEAGPDFDLYLCRVREYR